MSTASDTISQADVVLFDHNTANQIELLARVTEELRQQDILWGEQNHSLLHPRQRHTELGNYLSCASYWKGRNNTRVQLGTLAWDGILLEEVFEALSEDDPAKAVEELVQVAAVALNAALSVQRTGLRGKTAA